MKKREVCNLKIARELLGIIALISIMSITYAYYVVPIASAPDELSYQYFSTSMQENSQLWFEDSFNQNYNSTIFEPSNFVYNSLTNRIVSTGFSGMILLVSALATFGVNPYYVNPILSFITLFVFYSFVKNIFSSEIAFITIIIVGSLPIYFHYSTLLFTTIASFLVLILGLLYLQIWQKNQKNKLYLIIGIMLFSEWVLFRTPNAIFLISSVIPYVLYTILREKKNIINMPVTILYSMIPITAVAVQFFLLNNDLYGSPLSTGIALATNQAVSGTLNASPLSLINVEWHGIINALLNISLYSFYANPLFIIGLFSVICHLITRDKTQQSAFVMLLSISLFLFYASGYFHFWGYQWDHQTPHSSLNRYFFPMYILVVPYGVNLLHRTIYNKRVLALVLLLIVIINPLANMNSSFSTQYIKDYKEVLAQDQLILLENTEIDAIIFTKYWDKVIFPKRNVAVYTKIVENERINETVRLMSELKDDGKPVYFAYHFENLKFFNEFTEVLAKNDLILLEIIRKDDQINNNKETLILYQIKNVNAEDDEILPEIRNEDRNNS